MAKNRKNQNRDESGRIQLSRLESALVYHEANCRWGHTLALIERKYHQTENVPNSAGFLNFESLRSYLLSSRPGDVFDRNRFAIPDGYFTDYTTDVVAGLHGWCSSSRRVYRIGSDLQLLMTSTGFGKITWGDIKFPFNSFAIMLDAPICERYQEYDCILVSHQERFGRKWLVVSALSRYIDEIALPFDRLSEQYRKSYRQENDHLERKTVAQHRDLIESTRDCNLRTWYISAEHDSGTLLKDVLQVKDVVAIPHALNLGEESEEDSERAMAESLSIFAIAKRIVFGIPLYLASVPNPETILADEGEGTIPTSLRSNGRSTVVNGSHIFTIRNIHEIDREERENLVIVMDQNREGEKRKISPHFRTGYWRRPPGKGDDPTASKTVWVRPTLVNKGALKEGELPEGTGVNLH